MTDRFEWDSKLPGFDKRTRDGRETWVIQYRLGHKQRRMTIGTCGHRCESGRASLSNTRAIVASAVPPAKGCTPLMYS